MMEPPIRDLDPDRLFADLVFPPNRPVVAAVSGGSDSLALLLLLDAHCRNRARGGGLVAVTVDHGLRPEAAGEAAQVAQLCAARDIPHRTMRWDGDKPAAGLSAAARDARHRLLAEAAKSLGAEVVLTGHTANDQAETIAMRRERGDGRGLAGIAPATLYDGSVWFARPLLPVSRQALRDHLSAAGVAWIDDPSNEKEEYERVRARRALAGEDEALIRQTLVTQGRRAAEERVDAGRRAAALIRRHAGRTAPGLMRVDASLFREDDDVAARLAFRLVLATVGGREHLPDAARARGLFERLASGPGKGSLGGAVADRRKATVFLYREVRAGWTGVAPAVPGSLWDGRFRIAREGSFDNVIVESLGKTLAEARARTVESAAPQALVRAALAAEPMLHVRSGDDPERQGPSGTDLLARVVAPYARYMPSFDAEPAAALHDVMETPRPPAPPWASHNDA